MRIIFAAIVILSRCSGITSTQDLLDVNTIDIPLSVDSTSVTMNVSSQVIIRLKGGKPPYAAKVLGSGTVSITGAAATFTAAAEIDSPTLIISDSRGNQSTVAIQTMAVEISPSTLTGLALWLKADALSYANGATVTTWTDSSGNGRDFTMSAVAKPTFVSNFSNNLPAVSFNGSTQGIGRAHDANLNPSNMTLFALYYTETITPPVASTIVSSRGSLTGYHFQMSNTSLNYVGYCNSLCGAGYIYLRGLNLALNMNWYLSEFRSESQTSSFYLNGNLQGQFSNSGSGMTVNSTAPTSIGVADMPTPQYYFTGKVLEIILFNRAISTGEAQGIRCYLSKKYALTFGC